MAALPAWPPLFYQYALVRLRASENQNSYSLFFLKMMIMGASAIPSDFGHLSPAERILLVEHIWDSIAAEQPAVPLSSTQRAELDRRLEAFERTPDEGESWEEVKAWLLKNE